MPCMIIFSAFFFFYPPDQGNLSKSDSGLARTVPNMRIPRRHRASLLALLGSAPRADAFAGPSRGALGALTAPPRRPPPPSATPDDGGGGGDGWYDDYDDFVEKLDFGPARGWDAGADAPFEGGGGRGGGDVAELPQHDIIGEAALAVDGELRVIEPADTDHLRQTHLAAQRPAACGVRLGRSRADRTARAAG